MKSLQVLLIAGCLAIARVAAQSPEDARAREILSKMTLEEKIDLLSGTGFATKPSPPPGDPGAEHGRRSAGCALGAFDRVPGRHRDGGLVEPRSDTPRGMGHRPGGQREGTPHASGSLRQHQQGPAWRKELREFWGRPIPRRPHGRGLCLRRSGEQGHCLRQALCVQQPGDRSRSRSTCWSICGP